ncbi:MAG: hypothetical protein KAW12_20250 [Candidatus Aminicenantes bacterium]|nr:hypothetical protein [Candidatus Aminicenantes bacterium]
MARRTLPSFKTLWNRHKNLYLEVFSIALEKLTKKNPISGDEDAISERLCPILSCVCFDFLKSRNIEVPIPKLEGPIQPKNEAELTGGKKRKRPDFTCNYLNRLANSHEEYEISFHVECKRLGKPTSPGWILNENYVKNGIKRFDSKAHEYGKRSPSGMMIGYITGMSPKEIETEVNGYQEKYLPDYTNITFTFDDEKVSRARQAIERRSVCPEQFELIHLWADLRDNYRSN